MVFLYFQYDIPRCFAIVCLGYLFLSTLNCSIFSFFLCQLHACYTFWNCPTVLECLFHLFYSFFFPSSHFILGVFYWPIFNLTDSFFTVSSFLLTHQSLILHFCKWFLFPTLLFDSFLYFPSVLTCCHFFYYGLKHFNHYCFKSPVWSFQHLCHIWLVLIIALPLQSVFSLAFGYSL